MFYFTQRLTADMSIWAWQWFPVIRITTLPLIRSPLGSWGVAILNSVAKMDVKHPLTKGI